METAIEVANGDVLGTEWSPEEIWDRIVKPGENCVQQKRSGEKNGIACKIEFLLAASPSKMPHPDHSDEAKVTRGVYKKHNW